LFYQNRKVEPSDMDANGLDPEQQALLASIMGKSPQAGGGAAFNAAQVTPAAAPAAAPTPAPGALPGSDNPGRLLSQEEIDALIASMV
jgi:hypothetical protein